MIRCIIIDDEKPARDDLIYYLNNDSDIEVVGIGNNGVEAIELIHRHKPDVVFTDISMPLMNGIELAQKIVTKNINCKIIFVTAYDEYAIKAFELCAIDYLLKPLRDERVRITLERLKAIETINSYTNISNFINDYAKDTNKKPTHLCLYKDGILYPIKQNEILCIHVEDKALKVNTTKGVFDCYKTLSEIQQLLPSENFFKCHRSFIINLDFIKSIEPWFNRTFRVKLHSFEMDIPISRAHAQTFKKLMNII